VLSKEYSGDDILISLIEALSLKHSKERRNILQRNATHCETKLIIKHPGSSDIITHEDYEVQLYFYWKQPIAILQDPLHLKKTFRNNLYSGAQTPMLPNYPVLFSDIRNMALSENSPLFRRDVINVDRQDDNAATRVFSGAALEWLAKQRADQRGLIIYLFICGELIDAYQNRFIELEDRVQMVLRTHYFFELWEKFLDVGGYSKTKHYLSPQCVKITKTLIQGFFQILIIYRDYPNCPPLLPWLLCTEAVEHTFGICRQIVKDFTMLDFHLMVPKLFIRLREAFFSNRTSDGKATASGYCHTHTDTRDITLAALSTYPSNDEIQGAAVRAYDEAHSIFAYLGVTADQLYGSIVRLPSVSSWLADEAEDDDPEHEVYDEESVLLGVLENGEFSTERANKQLMDYRYAMVALDVDNELTMYVLAKYLIIISQLTY